MAKDESIGNVDEMIETQDTELPLPVRLTLEERLQAGEEMAQALSRAEQAEKDMEALKKSHKGIIDEALAEVSMQGKLLREGKKIVPVACSIVKNYRRGDIRTIRNDTGEMVNERPMTASERQAGLFTKKQDKDKA